MHSEGVQWAGRKESMTFVPLLMFPMLAFLHTLDACKSPACVWQLEGQFGANQRQKFPRAQAAMIPAWSQVHFATGDYMYQAFSSQPSQQQAGVGEQSTGSQTRGLRQSTGSVCL